jgi:hypothetical protein
VKNSGDRSADLDEGAITGPAAADFTIASATCDGAVLPAGGSCRVLLAFSPTAEGRREAGLKITDVSGRFWSASVVGVGRSNELSLTADPSALSFAARRVRTNSPAQTVRITNGTRAPQTFSSIRLSGFSAADFRVTRQDCRGASLDPGGDCRLDVTFGPRAEGHRSATLTLTVLGPLPDLVVPVTGTGLSALSGSPTLRVPSSVVREATGPNGAVVKYSATATDANGQPLKPRCQRASGKIFPLGTWTVACSATDAAGHTSTASFPVTVQDTLGPQIDVRNLQFEAVDANGADVKIPSITATDLVSGAAVITCGPSLVHLGVDEFRAVSCTAQDARGNGTTAPFTAQVVDTTAPALSLPDIKKFVRADQSVLVTYPDATANDLVDGELTVDCNPPSGSPFGFNTQTPVQCWAKDTHGNTGSGSFTVAVLEQTPVQ